MASVCLEALRYGSADFEAEFANNWLTRQVQYPSESIPEEVIPHGTLGDVDRLRSPSQVRRRYEKHFEGSNKASFPCVNWRKNVFEWRLVPRNISIS